MSTTFILWAISNFESKRAIKYLLSNILNSISGWGFLSCLALLSIFQHAAAQDNASIKGRIMDANTGSALVGASILETGSGRGTSSGQNGEFSLDLQEEQTQIEISFLGYGQLDTIVNVNGSEYCNFRLHRDTFEYEEVIIFADANTDYVNSVQMGEIRLKKEDMVNLPALMGESDPIRLLQLTPGVQSNTEGGIGFYVRGGGVDQNLVLYDNATIYNPGHLLGFLSVFNPDMVRDVSLIKSGIPARYGGRLSSVVQVNSEHGKSDSLRVKGQVGLISSRISLNRSFNKNRGSFIISARRASIDYFVKPVVIPLVKKSNPYLNESLYNFYDFNGSASYQIGENDFVFISGFYGKDKYTSNRMSIKGSGNISWGNTIFTGKWIHLLSERLNLNTTLSYSNYNFELSGSQSGNVFSMVSSIRDYNLKSQLEFNPSKHKLIAGVELTRHFFIPNDIDVSMNQISLDFVDFNKLYAYEGGGFIDEEVTFSNRLSMAAGLRYSFFNHMGPYTEYLYDDVSQINDSVVYPAGQSLAFYHHLEPRLSVKYRLGKDASLKASYMHMAQYIHLASAASISLPMDVWMPSSRDILPKYGDQTSIGYFKSWLDGQLESSVEAYFRYSKNQLEFIRGVVSNSIHMTMQENLAVGDGKSYGTEFFLRKKKGDLTGWIGYTIAKTVRHFEKINEGNIYPSKFDRRHDLSIAGIYRINEFWNISGVFIFVTGNAFTLPVGRYIIQGNLINEYGSVNSFRMPSYHRLDISASRSRVSSKGNISSWNFSIYNLYNRANPFYLDLDIKGDLEKYQVDVNPRFVSLFPILPSISWRFEF